MTELTAELVEQLTKNAGALETFVSELRQKKENERKGELPALEKGLREAIDEATARMLAESKAYVDEVTAAPKALVEAPASEHKSLGHWFQKALRGEIERKDFGEASGGVGGYLVPDAFIPQVLQIPMEQAVVRPRATVIPMTTDTAKIPALNEASRATNFYGGILGYWLAEANAITPTTWTAKEVSLSVNTLAGVGKVSKQLLADSPMAVERIIVDCFGNVIRFMEDEAFIRGDAANKPQGVIGSACEVAVTRAGAGDIATADVLGMLAAFLGSENRAVWVANRSVIPKLYAIKDGGNNSLFIANAGPTPSATLLGIPIVWSENASALGTKGDLMLCDFSYYLIGDRQQVVVDWTDHLFFLNIQSAVRLYERVEGKPWLDSTYTPRKGTARSPFVILN
jgi:HK97 family phage major capsid protein